jgi:hypothetical protein
VSTSHTSLTSAVTSATERFEVVKVAMVPALRG